MPYKKSRSKKFRRKSRKIKRKTLKINRRKSHKIKRRTSRKARGFTKRRTKYTGGAGDVSNEEQDEFDIIIEPYTGRSDYHTLTLTLTSKSPEISVKVHKESMNRIINYLRPRGPWLPENQLRDLPDNHPIHTQKWANAYLRGHEDFRDKKLTSITVKDSTIKLSELKRLLTIYKDTIRELTLVRTGLTKDVVNTLIGGLGIEQKPSDAAAMESSPTPPGREDEVPSPSLSGTPTTQTGEDAARRPDAKLLVTIYNTKTEELEYLKTSLENKVKHRVELELEHDKLHEQYKQETDPYIRKEINAKGNIIIDNHNAIKKNINSLQKKIAEIEAQIAKELEPGVEGLAEFLDDLEYYQ